MSFCEGERIRLHERLGFVWEGRLRRVACTRGLHQDELVYRLTAEEFRAAEEARRGAR
jgi:RimJ/RimL family protein N-acetyltransferase